MRYSCLYTLGGRDNGRPCTVFGSVHNLLFIAWHFKRASILRKRERNIWVPFLYMYALWFLSWRRKKKERKKMTILKFVFSASIKLSGNQRTYLYSGGSGLSIDIHFVDIELSYDVLSPLPIVLSKHFNHPHPYIEIATTISDILVDCAKHVCPLRCSLPPSLYRSITRTCIWSALPRHCMHEPYKTLYLCIYVHIHSPMLPLDVYHHTSTAMGLAVLM